MSKIQHGKEPGKSFHQWMRMRHEHYEQDKTSSDPELWRMADFILDALTDPDELPSDNLSAWRRYLTRHDACEQAVAGFETAWRLFTLDKR